MNDFTIIIHEHELYEKYPLELSIPLHVIEEIHELSLITNEWRIYIDDYTFDEETVEFSVGLAKVCVDDTEFLNSKKQNGKPLVMSKDVWRYNGDVDYYNASFIKASGKYSKYNRMDITKFMIDSKESMYNQIDTYIQYLEHQLNLMMEENVNTHINIHIIHDAKNPIDFSPLNRSEESDEEYEDKSSRGLSFKMVNYRNHLKELISNCSELSESKNTDIPRLNLNVSKSTYELIKSILDVNELYCMKLDNTSMSDLYASLVTGISYSEADDARFYADFKRSVYIDDEEASIFTNPDNCDMYSYFIGNKLSNRFVVILLKHASQYEWCEEVYILYNRMNEIQTHKIEDDGASVMISEIMFLDNGEIFKCYERADKECCGPDPVCQEIHPTRYKIEFGDIDLLDEDVNEEGNE